MIIVGVDPGKVTGIAMFVRTLRAGDLIHAEEVPAAQAGTFLRQWTAGIHDKEMIWAVEKYVMLPSRAKTAQPDALTVTGVVQGLAVGSRYVEQMAGPVKRLASDRVLKKLGWWQPTPDGHANDAKRQIVFAMAQYYPSSYAELLGI